MTVNVVVLGGAGMLGHAVIRSLVRSEVQLSATVRDPSLHRGPIEFRDFTVGDITLRGILGHLGPEDFVVNCIGIIKQRMNDLDARDRLNAIRVNSEFPYELARLSDEQGFRVIQIATDCVFSGASGGYTEASVHDAGDVYGKTKSLGEVPSSRFLNLRCSIIGQEVDGSTSLLGWLLSQPQNATIPGYSDHLWNGVTTEAFAEIATGLITSGSSLSGTHHLVPSDAVDKDLLSRIILQASGRDDVSVKPTVTGNAVNRTLLTISPEVNESLWRLGGFEEPPRIDAMVRALAFH